MRRRTPRREGRARAPICNKRKKEAPRLDYSFDHLEKTTRFYVCIHSRTTAVPPLAKLLLVNDVPPPAMRNRRRSGENLTKKRKQKHPPKHVLRRAPLPSRASSLTSPHPLPPEKKKAESRISIWIVRPPHFRKNLPPLILFIYYQLSAPFLCKRPWFGIIKTVGEE